MGINTSPQFDNKQRMTDFGALIPKWDFFITFLSRLKDLFHRGGRKIIRGIDEV